MGNLFSNQWVMMIVAALIAFVFIGGGRLISGMREKRKKNQAREDMRVEYTETIDDRKKEKDGSGGFISPDMPDYRRKAVEALKAEINRIKSENEELSGDQAKSILKLEAEINRIEKDYPAPPPVIATARKESWSKKGEINAEIINPVHRTIGLYHVELAPNKDYGRQYLYNSRWIFSLRINPDTNELQPAPHTRTMDHPPSEVYESIQTKELVTEVFGDHDEGDNKMKLGMLILAACIALFLMAMTVFKSSKGG